MNRKKRYREKGRGEERDGCGGGLAVPQQWHWKQTILPKSAHLFASSSLCKFQPEDNRKEIPSAFLELVIALINFVEVEILFIPY